MVRCVSYSPMYPYNAKSICIGRSHCVRETFCVSCLVYSRVSGIKKYLMYFILIVIFKGYISCHTSSCLKCAGGRFEGILLQKRESFYFFGFVLYTLYFCSIYQHGYYLGVSNIISSKFFFTWMYNAYKMFSKVLLLLFDVRLHLVGKILNKFVTSIVLLP